MCLARGLSLAVLSYCDINRESKEMKEKVDKTVDKRVYHFHDS